ncbi:hypothetical protein BS47DRAFT_1402123 [Hydnum rufescens UP504]|uniref:Anaphase-promoting complex subunit 5 domain-containing protein n=1 Tax=Hydnum rufescens UP504 TaxID=1448309 RepID=A0A9P6AD52_9AGAM|nr:hypothetical protein BS47DRAFT_1402123 [Hydnum rufescens UP504]
MFHILQAKSWSLRRKSAVSATYPGRTDAGAQVVRWETHRQPTGDPTHQIGFGHAGRKMNDLSRNLHDLGLWSEACEVQTMAVVLYRTEEDKPHLASGLFGLSLCLSGSGRDEEALRASAEASTRSIRPDLALSLNNLSVSLSKFGRDEEAFKANEEALGIHRLLATDRPKVFRPDLAYSLHKHSYCLSKFGRNEEALKANEEALKPFIGFARPQSIPKGPQGQMKSLEHSSLATPRSRPKVLRQGLAILFSNHANCFQNLAADRRKGYSADLAFLLTNHSHLSSEIGPTDRPKYRPDLAHISSHPHSFHFKFGRNEEIDPSNSPISARLSSTTPPSGLGFVAASHRSTEVFRSEISADSLTTTSIPADRAEVFRQIAAYLTTMPNPRSPEVFAPIALLSQPLHCSFKNLAKEEALRENEGRCDFRSLAADASKALKANEEALSLHRLLATDRPKRLSTQRRALSIRRLLAADRPEVFRPDLALSLYNHSFELSKFGRDEEALKANEDALAIYRFTSHRSPQKALNAKEEALSIRRLLAADRPEVFRPDLALSLYYHSIELSKFGRDEEALKTNEDALAIYRSLATDRPKVFLPDVVDCLNNRSNRLSKLGRDEEALNAKEEALSIRRLLAADRPETNEDALAIYRSLATDRPKVFLPDVVDCLNNRSNRLSKLGRDEEALNAKEEALSIRRLLAADRPEVFRPDLALSLYYHSIGLSKFGRDEEALKTNEDALAIYRLLAADRPKYSFQMSLIVLTTAPIAFRNLAPQIAPKGLKANEDALAIYRLLATDRPKVFLPDVADCLNNHSNRLSKLGRDEEALKADEEALSIRRLLAADRPKVFLPDLAHSLDNHSHYLSKFGRHEEALNAKEEALSIRRSLIND